MRTWTRLAIISSIISVTSASSSLIFYKSSEMSETDEIIWIDILGVPLNFLSESWNRWKIHPFQLHFGYDSRNRRSGWQLMQPGLDVHAFQNCSTAVGDRRNWILQLFGSFRTRNKEYGVDSEDGCEWLGVMRVWEAQKMMNAACFSSVRMGG